MHVLGEGSTSPPSKLSVNVSLFLRMWRRDDQGISCSGCLGSRRTILTIKEFSPSLHTGTVCHCVTNMGT